MAGFTRILFCLVGLALGAQVAKAQQLVTGLSLDKVEITSDFRGQELVVFGTVEGIASANTSDDENPTLADYDIVVVIVGPSRPGVIRKKERSFGIWINQEGVSFQSLPGSYLMMSTKSPEEEEEFNKALEAFSIGFRHIPLVSEEADAPVEEFRDALVRLKQRQGLYDQSADIQRIGSNLFRAKFRLPAVVPVGIHQVRSYLLYDNRLISGATQAIRISKSGFEQFVYRSARENGYLYGIVCVLMAILMGWLGSVIFRRD